MTTRTAKVGSFSRRMLAVAAVAAIALSLSLTLRVVQANELFENQIKDGPISWDDPAFQGTSDDCAGANLKPGQVLWHFVHTDTSGANLSSTIDADFDSAGTVTEDGYSNGGGNANVMYDVITGEDSLIGAEDTIVNGGMLLLSHICSNTEEQSVAESASEAESASAEQSTEASGEQSVEAGTGTPAQSTADSSLFSAGSSALPTIAFSLILLVSLGGLAYANVKAARS